MLTLALTAISATAAATGQSAALVAPASPPYTQRNEPVEVSASRRLPAYRPASVVGGHFDGATGMDSVEGMMAAWLKGFRRFHPDFDIALSMHDLAPEERIAIGPNTQEVFHSDDTVYTKKYGYRPFRIAVCQGAFVLKSHVSAIGVFVSKDNPASRISLAQLGRIYTGKRITRWGQLGLKGAWRARPVHPYGFYNRDDVTWYFRQLTAAGAPFNAEYRVPGEDLARRTPKVAQALMETLAVDPGAIGFANFSYQSDKVKALALIDRRGVVHQPVLREMVTGSYPLQRQLYVYVHRIPGRPLDPALKEFLTFILSRDGQDMVKADHYLPLTPEMAAAERAKLR